MNDSNPTFNQTFRYSASGVANNLIVSRGDILGILQCANGSGTAQPMSRLMNGVKVNWVDVYLLPNGGTSPTQTTFTWQSAFGKNRVYSLIAVGSANIPHFRAVPPRNSTASFWSITGSNESEPLFNMDTVTGVIIDINVSFTLQNFVDVTTNPVVTNSSKTVVGGIVYGFALDGIVTNILVPVGRLQG
jgi:hypothetical protein